MVKGLIKKNFITTEELLKATGGGWSIFVNEIPGLRIGRAFKSILRKDAHPSMAISCRDAIWFVKDFSNGKSYNAISFVQAKYGLTFAQAIEKLGIEYGLVVGEKKVYECAPMHIPPVYDGGEVQISFSEKKWTKKHEEFWEGTGVTEEHCRKFNTYAVKEAAIRHKKVFIDKGEVVWVYYADDIGGSKVYFPERDKGLKFKNNIPGNYLWYMNTDVPCETLFICKSNKDALVLSSLGLCVTATQSENERHIEPNLDILNKRAKRKVIVYGQDPQAWQESYKITKKYNWDYFNIPNEELKHDINDPYAYCKKYGIDALKELLKRKGYYETSMGK